MSGKGPDRQQDGRTAPRHASAAMTWRNIRWSCGPQRGTRRGLTRARVKLLGEHKVRALSSDSYFAAASTPLLLLIAITQSRQRDCDAERRHPPHRGCGGEGSGNRACRCRGLPARKASDVARLQREGHEAGFIGDGLDDARDIAVDAGSAGARRPTGAAPCAAQSLNAYDGRFSLCSRAVPGARACPRAASPSPTCGWRPVRRHDRRASARCRRRSYRPRRSRRSVAPFASARRARCLWLKAPADPLRSRRTWLMARTTSCYSAGISKSEPAARARISGAR